MNLGVNNSELLLLHTAVQRSLQHHNDIFSVHKHTCPWLQPGPLPPPHAPLPLCGPPQQEIWQRVMRKQLTVMPYEETHKTTASKNGSAGCKVTHSEWKQIWRGNILPFRSSAASSHQPQKPANSGRKGLGPVV